MNKQFSIAKVPSGRDKGNSIWWITKITVVLIFFGIGACKRDPIVITSTDYPKDIAYIMLSKCAVSGCHNNASYEAADHLNLSGWSKLFEGSSSGSTVIPYRTDFSSLLYFVNTFPDLGPVNYPTMPLHANPLSRDEMNRLRNWITAGAPDKDGNVKFADNPARKKFYVVNQGCRVVTVFDAQTLLPMRYIDIADSTEQNTSPHQVKLSPDGKYWYVCFIGGSYIKRYRTSDDVFEGKINVGNASWNTMAITSDSKFLFAVDWSASGPSGKVVKCDLMQMKVVDSTHLANVPHGSCISPDGKHIYITATNGNYIYKIHIDSLSQPLDYYNYVGLDNLGQSTTNKYNPHETIFSPDGSKYYVSCSGNNNGTGGDPSVKIFNAFTDTLIASVPLNSGAYEMSISQSHNLLFVSSYDGPLYYGFQGRIAVIDMTFNNLKMEISTGSQPHGLAVDDAAGLVYVANRNVSSATPPHHSSICGGANGSVVFIDLNTLMLTGRKIELSRDPYSVNIRF
jgi:DNA-binding beta-propeller fold protein YncE